MSRVPRLRVFAGPNGSGKSTIKAQVDDALWGQFVNADNIEAQLQASGGFDFSVWNIQTDADELRAFFKSSWVSAKRPDWARDVDAMQFSETRVFVGDVPINSYLATVIADFTREKLLKQSESFTFETVMSDKSKVAFMERARLAGYRTYLYYVATRDPDINISRVANRVQQGGHAVPAEKIRERYTRSLDLLLPALRASDRAYLWDNSGDSAVCFAEFDANRLMIRSSPQPQWFQTFVLDKLSP